MSKLSVRPGLLALLATGALTVGCDEISDALNADGGVGGAGGEIGGSGGEVGGAGGEIGGAGGEIGGSGGEIGGAGGEIGGAGGEIGGSGGEIGGAGGMGGSGGVGGGCDFSSPAPADAPRILLVSQPFTAEPGVPGTELRALEIDGDPMPVDLGERVDIGTRAVRIVFAPSGELALAVGEDGRLVSVAVAPDGSMEIIDAIQLPGGGYGDLHLSEDGTIAWAVNGNNQAQDSGIATVTVDCEGRLTHEAEAFFDIVLSSSMVMVPGTDMAILQGGQATFDPFIDDRDLRLLARDGLGWQEVAAFDIYGDFVTHARMAISPAGDTLLVPNNSIFSEEGNQVSVVDVAGSQLTEVARRVDLEDASEALFSLDGSTALVTLTEPGQVAVFAEGDDGLMDEVERITGIGLSEQMARIARGANADTVYLSSVDPAGGSNIAVLRIDGGGEVVDLGQVGLGEGAINIPDAIAVLP